MSDEKPKVVHENGFVTVWEFKGLRIVGHRDGTPANGFLFFAVHEPAFASKELSRFATIGAAKKFISGRTVV